MQGPSGTEQGQTQERNGNSHARSKLEASGPNLQSQVLDFARSTKRPSTLYGGGGTKQVLLQLKVTQLSK